jgi:hypothetical protein
MLAEKGQSGKDDLTESGAVMENCVLLGRSKVEGPYSVAVVVNCNSVRGDESIGQKLDG